MSPILSSVILSVADPICLVILSAAKNQLVRFSVRASAQGPPTNRMVAQPILRYAQNDSPIIGSLS